MPNSEGPPAFPTDLIATPGLTMRDWFAGMALQAIIGVAKDERNSDTFAKLARDKGVHVTEAMAGMAYQYATAMMKMRAR